MRYLSSTLFEHFKLTCFVFELICKYFLPFHRLPFYGICYDVAQSGSKLGVLPLWNYRSKPSQHFTFQFQECFISFLIIHITPTHHKVSNSKLRTKERNSYHETRRSDLPQKEMLAETARNQGTCKTEKEVQVWVSMADPGRGTTAG